jgi:hypothetical protein
MSLDDLTIKEAKEIAKLFSSSDSEPKTFFVIGEKYLIRTVTMIYTGKLADQSATELKLIDAAWIPETTRWADCLLKGEFLEVEPYPNEVVLFKAAIVDCSVWRHDLPRTQK